MTQVPGSEIVWRELRAMRVVDAEGWAKYVCGDQARRTHVVDIGRPAPRTLVKGEAFWWAQGFADACREGGRVQAVLLEKVPQLLTMDVAAERVPALKTGQPLTEQGVRRTVPWYPLHVPRPHPSSPVPGGRARYVFEAQVAAEAALRKGGRGAAAVVARWQALQEKLPPLVRMAVTFRDITPDPSPEPLPIPGGQAEAARRAAALKVGHLQGWFSYRHPVAGGFVVTLPDGQERVLTDEGALPWVLGFADATGPEATVLVAYRHGLG